MNLLTIRQTRPNPFLITSIPHRNVDSRIKVLICSNVGMEGMAPNPVVTNAPAALEKSAISSRRDDWQFDKSTFPDKIL
jgi:hypothetical protein